MATSFDFIVHPKGGRPQEFRNLPKADLHALLVYISRTGLAMHNEAGGDSQDEGAAAEPEGSNSSEVPPTGVLLGNHVSLAGAVVVPVKQLHWRGLFAAAMTAASKLRGRVLQDDDFDPDKADSSQQDGPTANNKASGVQVCPVWADHRFLWQKATYWEPAHQCGRGTP